MFTTCYAEHIIGYRYHLHIQDSIYIVNMFSNAYIYIYIRISYKKTIAIFLRVESLTFAVQSTYRIHDASGTPCMRVIFVMRDTRLWDRAIFDGIPPVRGLTRAVTDDRLFPALILPRAPLEHPRSLLSQATAGAMTFLPRRLHRASSLRVAQDGTAAGERTDLRAYTYAT